MMMMMIRVAVLSLSVLVLGGIGGNRVRFPHQVLAFSSSTSTSRVVTTSRSSMSSFSTIATTTSQTTNRRHRSFFGGAGVGRRGKEVGNGRQQSRARSSSPRSSTSSTTCLYFTLTTALESLANERYHEYNNNKNNNNTLSSEVNVDDDYDDEYNYNYYKHIQWFDPTSHTGTTESESAVESADDGDNDISTKTMIVPLYPLSEVYVPSSSTSSQGEGDDATSNTNTNHYYTLNNIEPKNIQMALDLISQIKESDDSDDRIFCVVLYAIDTGNIANVGTLLRIVDYDIQYNDYNDKSKITKVQLTCETVVNTSRSNSISDDDNESHEYDHEHDVGLVQIVSIENPSAASKIQRLKRSTEYLRAKVKPIKMTTTTTTTTTPPPTTTTRSKRRVVKSKTDGNNNYDVDDDDHSSTRSSSTRTRTMIDQMIHDWNLKKTMYSLGIGNRVIMKNQDDNDDYNDNDNNDVVLLPNTLTNIAEGMSTWDISTFYYHSDDSDSDESSSNPIFSTQLFWNAVQEYQSICYTIRNSMQGLLSSERNEIMVSEAMKVAKEKCQPLSLPIDIEDLSPTTRQLLDTMTVQTQTKFIQRQLDPTLDMLALVTLPTYYQRIKYFAYLLSRERSYLETLATQYTSGSSARRGASTESQSSNDSYIDEDLDFSIFDDYKEENVDNGSGSGGKVNESDESAVSSLMDIYRDRVNRGIKKRIDDRKRQQEQNGAWFQDDLW